MADATNPAAYGQIGKPLHLLRRGEAESDRRTTPIVGRSRQLTAQLTPAQAGPGQLRGELGQQIMQANADGDLRPLRGPVAARLGDKDGRRRTDGGWQWSIAAGRRNASPLT
ncbi:hypothetical protein ABZY93_31850 [Streptomyces smyrnaeus]|uniref:hypothetical protein n=1 Tax=Streptomyces smyrnaeus TaxID=1387713 RepID=UPI0033B145CF